MQQRRDEPTNAAAGQPPVLVEAAGSYRLITLNRPDRLNAFTVDLHRALRAALDEAARDDACRAVILTGAGRGFCAGQDLVERLGDAQATPDLGATIEAFYNPLIAALRALPLPVIAAVNGVAAGAGANLALACDIVLAGRSAKFIQAFTKIGLVPDSGGTWLLPRLVGSARARGLALLAEPLPAEKAEAWGLVWKVVDDAALLDEARATALALAALPAEGLALTKQALALGESNGLEAQLEVERDLQRRAGRTADYREAVAAFVGKRPPAFRAKRPA